MPLAFSATPNLQGHDSGTNLTYGTVLRMKGVARVLVRIKYNKSAHKSRCERGTRERYTFHIPPGVTNVCWSRSACCS